MAAPVAGELELAYRFSRGSGCAGAGDTPVKGRPASGGVCVHTHVVGPQVADQVTAMQAGDIERAREIDRSLAPAYDLLKIVANPIAIKAALSLLGHTVGGHRLPLVPATS